MQLKSIVCAGAVLVLAACSNQSGIFNMVQLTSYTSSTPVLAAADGPVAVTVRNSPFGGASANDDFAAAMPSDNFRRLQFTGTPSQTRWGYRLVFEFADIHSVGVPSVCDTDKPALAPLQAKDMTNGLPFRAGFCRKNAPMSEVSGIAPAAASVTDPAFKHFLANLLQILTPSRNPDLENTGTQIYLR